MARSRVLIKDGVIVNHDGIVEADILIEGEKIKTIAQDIQPGPDAKVIDAKGLYVIPGGVDPDCRLANPNYGIPVADSYKDGSIASLCGGTTTIVNEVTVPPSGSITEAYECQRRLLNKECHCDFTFTLSLPTFSLEVADQMKSLASESKVAAFSFRLRCGDSPSVHGVNEEALMDAMQLCSSLRIPLSVVSCGNAAVLDKLAASAIAAGFTGPEGSLVASPERLEADTISRVGLLSGLTNCPVILTRIHSLSALKALIEQQDLGNVLFGETSIAAVGCNYAGNTVMNTSWAKAASSVSDPPIRAEDGIAKNLLAHLATGELMAVGSAHRAFTTGVRAGMGLNDFRKIPAGQATAGGRLSALWRIAVEKEAILDPCQFVAAISTNPALLYNLYPRKGRIAEGSDADIVVWKHGSKEEPPKLLPEGVEDPFDGLGCTCGPKFVLLRGRVVVKDGKLIEQGEFAGQFICPEGSDGLIFRRIAALKAASEAKMAPVPRDPYTGPIFKTDSYAEESLAPRESHFYRKSDYDNAPRDALPPGQRVIHTSVKTAHSPGGGSSAFWWNS